MWQYLDPKSIKHTSNLYAFNFTLQQTTPKVLALTLLNELIIKVSHENFMEFTQTIAPLRDIFIKKWQKEMNFATLMMLRIKMIHYDQTQQHIQTAHTALSVFPAEKIHASQLSKLSEMTGCRVTPDACQPHAQMCHFQMVQVIPRPAPWCSDNGSSITTSNPSIQTSSGCVYASSSPSSYSQRKTDGPYTLHLDTGEPQAPW